MPTSTDAFKEVLYNHIEYLAKKNPSFKILDAGAGYGKYGRTLSHLDIDALEIHKPYIEEFELHKFYKNVYNEDILNFDIDCYDYIILGDILEHIKVEEAQKLIKKIYDKQIKCLVGVPFLMPQSSNFEFLGKKWEVESEIHYQSDLTERVMKSRYPTLNPFIIYKSEHIHYGYYTNYIKFIL